ncbi:hypothetical protein P5673_005097 [Acropora cervicornis]|uniref:Uncharacterized protein n=1 Tax=Acropora cervicornis TaxID=6130 RepID=A0AAD9QZD9_ACRCE|nr:hypothetical protein P5673_005097 [Acropora cervicornis]
MTGLLYRGLFYKTPLNSCTNLFRRCTDLILKKDEATACLSSGWISWDERTGNQFAQANEMRLLYDLAEAGLDMSNLWERSWLVLHSKNWVSWKGKIEEQESEKQFLMKNLSI